MKVTFPPELRAHIAAYLKTVEPSQLCDIWTGQKLVTPKGLRPALPFHGLIYDPVALIYAQYNGYEDLPESNFHLACCNDLCVNILHIRMTPFRIKSDAPVQKEEEDFYKIRIEAVEEILTESPNASWVEIASKLRAAKLGAKNETLSRIIRLARRKLNLPARMTRARA